MRRTTASLRFLCFSLLVAAALALYGECLLTGTHHEFAVERETVSIHCAEALFIPNSQADPTAQSPDARRNLGQVPVNENVSGFVVVPRIKDHSFQQPLSQQDLFRFEKVYRL